MKINQLEEGWQVVIHPDMRLGEKGGSREVFRGPMPKTPQEVGAQIKAFHQVPYPSLLERDKSAEEPAAIGRCSLTQYGKKWTIRVAKWAGSRFSYQSSLAYDVDDETLGAAILAVLQRSAVKPQYYKNPNGHQPLAAEVLAQLDRLDIPYELKAHPYKETEVAHGYYEIPLALQQLSDDVRWSIVEELYDGEFDDDPQEPTMDSAYDTNQNDNPPYALYELFYSQRSQYYYMCRLDAENPGNPWVYHLDHDGSDWERELTALGEREKPSGSRLSDLLADLQREPEDE